MMGMKRSLKRLPEAELEPVSYTHLVIAQDADGAVALVGQAFGAPLLHAGAGDRFAVAVLGVVRLDRALLADVAVSYTHLMWSRSR